jgi:dephospho-CoA kinase
MIKIGILGDIGSGKSYVAKNFGYPVFNADNEVGKLYKKERKIFNKLKKVLPKFFRSFPINKKEISDAILANESNLRKNMNQEVVILDIPLLLENKINKKNDILIFVKSKKKDIFKRLKKRKNFNLKLYKKFKNIQLSLDYKKKKSLFVIKNDFTNKSVTISIKKILKKIL